MSKHQDKIMANIPASAYKRGTGRRTNTSQSKQSGTKQTKGSFQASSSKSSSKPAENVDRELIAQYKNRIESIQKGFVGALMFSIASSEDIMGAKGANCRVTNNVCDLSMGPLNQDDRCTKCGNVMKECPGHFGYIQLAVPIYNPAFIEELTKILTIFSFYSFTTVYEGDYKKLVSEYKKKNLPKNSSSDSTNAEQIGQDYQNSLVRASEYARQKLREKGTQTVVPLFDVEVVNSQWINIQGTKRLSNIYNSVKSKNDVNATKPIKYSLNERRSGHLIKMTIGDKPDYLNPMTVYAFLKALDEDVDSDGNNRRWSKVIGLGDNKLAGIVMKYLPVLPNTVRPNKLISGNIQPHAITNRYERISEANKQLFDFLNSVGSTISDSSDSTLSKNFQLIIGGGDGEPQEKEVEVETKVKGKSKNITGANIYKTLNIEFRSLFFETEDGFDDAMGFSSDAQKVSFKTILDGKKGVIRGEGLGKKADYSGRTVVIGDPLIDVDEVGLSEVFASDFTIPEEIVSDKDLDKARKMMSEGKVIRVDSRMPNGNFRTIDYKQDVSINLKTGDVIRRKLQTGDPVVLSRQPVLHKGGYMGFYCRLIPQSGNVIRINPAVTSPFNADFDGDEMNVAIPQNIYTRQEVMRIMMVTNCIRGDKASAPWIGLIQNGVIGITKMTSPAVRLTRADIFDIMSQAEDVFNRKRHSKRARSNFNYNPRDFIKKMSGMGVNPFTGRGAISYFFPVGFKYEREIKGGENVDISDGVLVTGTLSGSDIGRSKGGVVDSMLEQYDAETVIIFLSSVQQAVRRWLERIGGFSISYDDCNLNGNPTSKFKPQDTLNKYINEAREEASIVMGSEVMSEADIAMRDKKIRSILAAVRDKVTKLIKTGGVDVLKNQNELKDEKVKIKQFNDIFQVTLEINKTLKFNRLDEQDVQRINKIQNRITSAVNDPQINLAKVGLDVLAEETITLQTIAHIIDDNDDEKASKVFLSRGPTLKQKRLDVLNNAIKIRRELMWADKFDTSFLELVRSGAKGSPDNVTQVMGLLGQQDLPESSRILPFFEKDTTDPAARGFCSSSFTQGLTPIEFFMHASASRVNVIENNLKPSETGHFFRRAYNIMEDMVSYEDGSVRDESGRVVQFVYGGDFFDARRVVNVKDVAQFIDVNQIAKGIRIKAGKQEYNVEYKPIDIKKL